MSTFTIHPKMLSDLDSFFAQKTITDVDRNTFQILNLKDPSLKITVSLVFMRDWHSIESDDYNVVSIRNCGAVFTFPCYWISVPKELCIPYFTAILEDFYTNELSKWDIDIGSNINGSTPNLPCGGNNQGNCNCNCK